MKIVVDIAGRSGHPASRERGVKCAEIFNIAGQGAHRHRRGSGLGLASPRRWRERARVTLLDVERRPHRR